jgi:hypothetical protein
VTAYAAAARARRTPAEAAEAAERSVRRRVELTWGLLILNVLTFYPSTWSGQPLIIHIPSVVGKLIAQGALPAALFTALTVNRRKLLRPSVFMGLAFLLVVEAFITCLQARYLGTIYRSFRLAGFVTTVWLLSPWWGRRDLLLVRCQIMAMSVVLGTVLLGFAVSPSRAYGGHRLAGAFWPTPPTQVAEFAAVTIGLVVVMWLSRRVAGWVAGAVSLGAGAILYLSHTRTALAALVAGVLVAGLSLVIVESRVRKLFGTAVVVVSIGILAFSSVLSTWLARGENTGQLTDLTGRTDVWSAVVGIPRDKFQVIFGFGLSNKSYNGLPIDSNWLASYFDQGLLGVIVCAVILIFLLVNTSFQPRGVQRALALFLVTYCLVASFTETGFSDASTYLLYLALAATLTVARPGPAGLIEGSPA